MHGIGNAVDALHDFAVHRVVNHKQQYTEDNQHA